MTPSTHTKVPLQSERVIVLNYKRTFSLGALTNLQDYETVNYLQKCYLQNYELQNSLHVYHLQHLHENPDRNLTTSPTWKSREKPYLTWENKLEGRILGLKLTNLKPDFKSH